MEGKVVFYAGQSWGVGLCGGEVCFLCRVFGSTNCGRLVLGIATLFHLFGTGCWNFCLGSLEPDAAAKWGRMLGAQSSFGWSIPFASGAKARTVWATSCGNELLVVLLVFDNGCFQGSGTGFWEDLHSYGFLQFKIHLLK